MRMIVVCAVVGCADPANTVIDAPLARPDAPADARPLDARPDARMIDAPPDADFNVVAIFSGVVRHLDDQPVGFATVTFVEDPTLTTKTALDGTFQMIVPKNTPLNLRITHPLRVPTRAQTVIFKGMTTGQSFRMAAPDQYAFIGTFGPDAPAPRGHARMDLNVPPTCNYVGGHINVSPVSGTIAYAQSNQLPNSTYTAFQTMAPGAYLVAATGTITPVVTDLQAPCVQRAWPVDLGYAIIPGPITIEDGAYHDVTVFLEVP